MSSIELHGFADIRQFRVQLPTPLFPYRGKGGIKSVIESELRPVDHHWLSIDDLSEFFTPNFKARNPLNIPGPIYGGETDTCLTGPAEAPCNVLVDRDGQEFVYKQAENAAEFRDLVSAAICECFVGYGIDGDANWRLSTIREWWRTRTDMLYEVGEEWCDKERVEQWRHALEGGAKGYLRTYAFFVENGRLPDLGNPLPFLD